MKRRWFVSGAALAAAPAAAQTPSVSADTAPLAWRRYARDVEAMLIAVLGTDAAAGLRDAAGEAGQRVRLWIGRDGRFTKVEAAGAPDFAAGLAERLAATRAPVPPVDMAWPMTLLLRLDSVDRG